MKFCDNCNVNLNENDDCPICGNHFVYVNDSFCMNDKQYDLRKQGDCYKSKKHKWFETTFLKIELNRDRNIKVYRYKKEDRLNNIYEEHIETLDGQVIHSCKEKLTEHFGHGNAKNKDKNQTK